MKTLVCRLTGLAVLVSAPLWAGACAGGSGGHGGPLVRVSERDFHISAPRRVSPGELTFAVANRGPDAHEFIVVRKDERSLPIRRDGLTVDEDAVEPEEAGALEPGAPGANRELRVDLKAGRYELLCNMSGHYMGGMHRDLVVR